MKKILIGLCLLTASSFIYATNVNTIASDKVAYASMRHVVPERVKEAFHKDYPDASAVRWTYTNQRWDARFHKMDGNMDMLACYDIKGHHIDSRMPVAQSNLPPKVINHLNDRYYGGYTHSFTKIQRHNKSDLYRVRVKEQGTYRTLYLDKKGKERDYASR